MCGASLMNAVREYNLKSAYILILGLIKDLQFVHVYKGKSEIRRKHHQHKSHVLFSPSMLLSSLRVDRTRGRSHTHVLRQVNSPTTYSHAENQWRRSQCHKKVAKVLFRPGGRHGAGRK